jgi:hypothetical protein
MKRFFAAIAFACLLSASTLAGDLPTSGTPSPSPGDLPTSGSPAPMGTTSPGDLPTSGFAEQLSDAALYALLSVLGVAVA